MSRAKKTFFPKGQKYRNEEYIRCLYLATGTMLLLVDTFYLVTWALGALQAPVMQSVVIGS